MREQLVYRVFIACLAVAEAATRMLRRNDPSRVFFEARLSMSRKIASDALGITKW